MESLPVQNLWTTFRTSTTAPCLRRCPWFSLQINRGRVVRVLCASQNRCMSHSFAPCPQIDTVMSWMCLSNCKNISNQADGPIKKLFVEMKKLNIGECPMTAASQQLVSKSCLTSEMHRCFPIWKCSKIVLPKQGSPNFGSLAPDHMMSTLHCQDM